MTSGAEHLVIAVTHVPGSTKACARRGDVGMFDTLQAYYALAAEAAAAAGGRVVKPIGDGVLLSFPVHRASQAVEALRELQERATALWRAFDSKCSVQVKVGAGTVRSGRLGPPGDERYDIVGDALNQLFKAPWADFVVLQELKTLLG